MPHPQMYFEIKLKCNPVDNANVTRNSVKPTDTMVDVEELRQSEIQWLVTIVGPKCATPIVACVLFGDTLRTGG